MIDINTLIDIEEVLLAKPIAIKLSIIWYLYELILYLLATYQLTLAYSPMKVVARLNLVNEFELVHLMTLHRIDTSLLITYTAHGAKQNNWI